MPFETLSTPEKGLAIAKEVFELLHKRGLSEAETFGMCALLAALAGQTCGIPKHDTIKAVRASFDMVDDLMKNLPHHH